MDHDSARLGALRAAGIGFTRASWSAYRIMKGVISASVSAGSSHRVASVMWAAVVTVEAGWAPTGAGPSSASAMSGTNGPSGRSARVMGASRHETTTGAFW